jgi:hypothetical protein
MARELPPIDIATIPGLARLADEVERTRRPRRLHRNGRDVAVVMPLPPEAGSDRARLADEQLIDRLRLSKGSIVAATAGVVRYDGPPLRPEEERAAFEQGVADEGMECPEE